jgi:hypothetical protein
MNCTDCKYYDGQEYKTCIKKGKDFGECIECPCYTFDNGCVFPEWVSESLAKKCFEKKEEKE